MIFDQANIQHLKAWLVRTLEPICDAEPGALADYVLALLQHNIPENELRNDLTAQLDEFLEKECPSFIETLFTALRSKSYLPYTTSSPPSSSKSLDGGIPIPLDGLLTPSDSRKRPLEHEENENGRPPKGPRLSSEDQYSRYGAEGDSRSGGSSRGRGSSNGYPPQPGRNSAYNPPDQRKICRDYYNLGYCSRGALCKYSHGDDAIVPAQMYMNGPMMQGGMPFMPMFNGFGMGSGPAAAYDPHEARMDMRHMGNNRQMRPPVLPRTQNEEGRTSMSNAPGELPVIQDLTPEVAYRDVTPNPQYHTSHSSQLSSQTSGPAPTGVPPQSESSHNPSAPNHSFQSHPPHPSSTYPPQDVEMAGPSDLSQYPRPMNNGFRGRGRGGKPGSFRPERRNDKTLVLEKIPDDKLSLEHVNDWFKRFGTVTNVAIDQAHNKALISFATHEEARSAWKSEDAVFNNRFVKVFWHRPMEGQGQVGQRLLAASAPIVSGTNTKDTSDSKPPQPSQTPSKPAPHNTIAAKQQKLEQLISEQKSQMSSLDQASSDEKKEIMSRLRAIDEEMKSISASITTGGKSSAVSRDKEQQERERLDKELDLHGAVNGEEEGKESTEDLKAKLEKLKAEAARLGIPADPEPHHGGGGGYRPYRGRARGFHRGGFRGGPPRGSMKLDNRPKKLLVKAEGSDGLQAIRDWYETTGQLEDATQTEDGGVIVSFRTRHAAEQGFAKGTSIPMLGSVQVTWYAGTTSPAQKSSSTKDASMPSVDVKSEAEASPRRSPPHSPSHEEEFVASGWGGNDEDGMGMI
ncbi:hypothetical protein VNI00_001882 [Paramarasmius palmivorus]|uniref:Uncharacterized protein n=1 Tax=Paramarasmius palmivorus TaxID=297713 RepID=A0AAW0E068_9AGAR